MDKYDNSDLNQDRYLESLIDEHSERNSAQGRQKKSRRRFLAGGTAVLTALAVAVGAVAVSGSEENGSSSIVASEALSSGSAVESSDTASLTLTDTTGLTDESQTAATGYVLTDVSDVVEEILPSVVSITSRTLVNYYNDNHGFYGDGGLQDIWDYFFGDSSGNRSGDHYYYYEYPQQGSPESDSNGSENNSEDAAEESPNEVDSGMGSGTIIGQNSTELLILTSYHVVEDCSSLYVTFINDADVDGYIKAADEERDIAVVAVPLEDINQETLDSIKIATISTEEAKIGEGVLVVGNALGYGISVTSGIVSAVNREITLEGRTMEVIQTDAAINFGNSGGCMLNAKGEVIGISEAKATISYVEGMCYAIPVVSNLDLIQSLMNAEGTYEERQAAAKNGAYLGVRGRDVTAEISNDYGMPVGVYVSSTVRGSGAEEAGLQSGDIIVGIDDTVISTMEELQEELSYHAAGDVVTLVINRLQEGTYTSITLEVTLTDRIS